MQTMTKALVGTLAAGAMVLGSASPAFAQRDRDRRHDHDRGVSAGDVIAGALIIGGIAAIAGAASRNDRDRGDYYDRYGSPREAVERCVVAVENRASRRSYGGRADVTDIRSIRDIRGGYSVTGRVAVNTGHRNWRNGDARYGNGWGGDYRGWNDRLRGYDVGSFTCDMRYGRIDNIDFRGLRGF